MPGRSAGNFGIYRYVYFVPNNFAVRHIVERDIFLFEVHMKILYNCLERNVPEWDKKAKNGEAAQVGKCLSISNSFIFYTIMELVIL